MSDRSIEDVVDEVVATMWPQKPRDPERESELARAIREREEGPW